MFVVALTGNMATGKSLVSHYFSKLGARIINADQIAKEIREKASVKAKIIEHFGPSILKNDELDRPALRNIVFNNINEKKWLENLLHPLIRQQIEHQIQHADSQYVILEIPLHFRREDYPYIDKVIVVHAEEKEQIKRIMARDHCTEEEARAAVRNQPDLNQRLSIADDLIENNGQLALLEDKVIELDRKYKSMSNK